jgi:hypothetical protein
MVPVRQAGAKIRLLISVYLYIYNAQAKIPATTVFWLNNFDIDNYEYLLIEKIFSNTFVFMKKLVLFRHLLILVKI